MNLYRFPVLLTIYASYFSIASMISKPVLAFIPLAQQNLLIAQADNREINLPLDLKPGSQGENIKILQNYLQELGYFQGNVDGVYGEDTKVAVAKFQKDQNLNNDGLVGESTWIKLKDALYSHYMNRGYEAEKNQDYATALNNFQQALRQRPNDFYALDAIDSVEKKITNSAKSPNNPGQKILWLIVLGVIIAATGGGLFFLFKVFSFKPQFSQSEDLSDFIDFDEDEKIQLPLDPPEPKDSHSHDLNLDPSEPRDSHNHNLNLDTKPKSAPEKPSKPNLSKVRPIKPKSTSDLAQNSSVSNTSRLAKVDIIEELIKDLRQPEPTKRKKAIWELAQRADSRAMQPLVNLMLEADSQERSLILEAVSQIASRTLKPLNRALTIALQDENMQVRQNAIRDLTRIYELISNVSQQLSLAVDDPDREVQETAKWALDQLNQIKITTHSANIEQLPINSNSLNFRDNSRRELS